jgi:uncharacterized protein
MVKSMSDGETIYLDTNILVSMHTEDALSARAIEWFDAQDVRLAISEWVCVEFNAVTGLRNRKRELRRDVAIDAIDTLQKRAQSHFIMLPVTNEATALAGLWLRNPDCTLQTGDALHLAIAHTSGATTLATFDERFAKAAQKLKLGRLKIELIGEKVRRVEQRRARYVVSSAVVTKKVAAKKKMKR